MVQIPYLAQLPQLVEAGVVLALLSKLALMAAPVGEVRILTLVLVVLELRGKVIMVVLEALGPMKLGVEEEALALLA
jgi:hypothetical protein